MLTLMAMSFSILWSVSTGPFFIYLLYLFSAQNDDIFYVIRNSIFFLIDWNISETWLRINLDIQLSKMLLRSYSEKKNALFRRKRSCCFFFSVKQPCHRTSSSFILSMFSRKIYAKIILKKILERYSVKKYF